MPFNFSLPTGASQEKRGLQPPIIVPVSFKVAGSQWAITLPANAPTIEILCFQMVNDLAGATGGTGAGAKVSLVLRGGAATIQPAAFALNPPVGAMSFRQAISTGSGNTVGPSETLSITCDAQETDGSNLYGRAIIWFAQV